MCFDSKQILMINKHHIIIILIKYHMININNEIDSINFWLL